MKSIVELVDNIKINQSYEFIVLADKILNKHNFELSDSIHKTYIYLENQVNGIKVYIMEVDLDYEEVEIYKSNLVFDENILSFDGNDNYIFSGCYVESIGNILYDSEEGLINQNYFTQLF